MQTVAIYSFKMKKIKELQHVSIPLESFSGGKHQPSMYKT